MGIARPHVLCSAILDLVQVVHRQHLLSVAVADSIPHVALCTVLAAIHAAQVAKRGNDHAGRPVRAWADKNDKGRGGD